MRPLSFKGRSKVGDRFPVLKVKITSYISLELNAKPRGFIRFWRQQIKGQITHVHSLANQVLQSLTVLESGCLTFHNTRQVFFVGIGSGTPDHCIIIT